MKISHFKCSLSRDNSVPKYLDEEGDFVSFDFRTCEGNMGTILSLYHTR